MIEIIPAILEQDFSEIEKKIHRVEDLVKWVQIDIADNTLVPNTTFLDPAPFARFTTLDLKTGDGSGRTEGLKDTFQVAQRDSWKVEESENVRKLDFELHMMVKDPLRYLERFAAVGFKRFFAHVEGEFVPEYIEKCYQLGVEAGLAIDGETPPTKILPYLDKLDCVLVMAIEAGESGRPFREDTVDKIKKIREVDFEIPIAVDGAMNDVNAVKVVAAGVTRINSNSFIFGAPDVKMAIEKLKSIK